jgi:membrane-bound serine protease (ClpP class)
MSRRRYNLWISNSVASPRAALLAAAGLVSLALLGATVSTAQDSAPRRSGAIIPIAGEIEPVLRDSIERRMSEARREGITTLIFEMDTPGGRVDAALDIFRLIERFDGRTIAWVNPEAYSAGALISVACDEIWMSPDGSIGDCAPILISPAGPEGGDEALRAKMESPILERFRDAAARNEYNQLLARAMVTMDQEVWWLERIDDPDERKFVDTEEKVALIDDVAEEDREWQLVEGYTEPGSDRQRNIAQPIVRGDELLTMSSSEAIAFGFARGLAQTSSELAEALNLATPLLAFERSGWEVFAAWLNSPLIRGLLLIILFVGAYTELQSPGLIVPGAAALIALAILLAAPYAAGLATAWPIVLLILGLVLLAVEIFVLPGFGIAGLIGASLVIIALLGTFVPPDPQSPNFGLPDATIVWQGLANGLKVFVASVAISIAGILMLIRYLPQSKVAAGVITNNPRADELALSDAHLSIAQVGDVGIVTGDLRPAGQARFGQEIVAVRSQGEYVEAGRRVQVIKRDGMSIVVRPLADDDRA